MCAFVTDKIPDILVGTVNVPDIICETGATRASEIDPAVSLVHLVSDALVWKNQWCSANIPAFANDEVPDTEFLVRSVKVFDMVCKTVAPGTPAVS